jgi:hypothetical protein
MNNPNEHRPPERDIPMRVSTARPSGTDALDESTDTCGATTRSGSRCRNVPVPGRHRCRLHGGATPRGYLSPNFRGKGYSTFVDPNLGRVLDAVGDVDSFIDASHEVTLLRGRLAELAQSLSDDADPRAWSTLKRDAQALVAAFANDDIPAARKLADAIADRTSKAVRRNAHWKDIESAARTFAKIVDHQRKVADLLSQIVSRDVFARMWNALTLAIANVIRREDQRRAIGDLMRGYIARHPYRDEEATRGAELIASGVVTEPTSCPTCGQPLPENLTPDDDA